MKLIGDMFMHLLPRFFSLLRTSLSVVLARFSSIALFALTARIFSQHDNGQFIFAITLPQLLTQLGTIGWLNLIRREVARRSEISPVIFKGFILRSFQVPMIPVLCAAVGMILYGLVREEDRSLYFCIATVITVYAVVAILREYLIALGMPALSIAASEVLPVVVTGGVVWLIQPERAAPAALAFLLGLLVSCAIQIPVVLKALRPYLNVARPTFNTRAWIRAGGLSLLGFGGRAILDRLDTLVLATLGPAVQFALYNSAQRATVLLLVAPTVLLPVFSPHVSKASARGDIALLRREMALQTLLVTLCALPLAWLLMKYPAQIMGFLFGARYEDSSQYLGLIVFSQVLFAFSLPWSNLMLMSGREAIYAYAHLLALVVVLPLAIGLVGTWGGYAVALASLISNVLLFAIFFGIGIYGLLQQDSANLAARF
ncbi:lipopolysaccharide biosynthesis protein [Herbaspirillum sp. GW103]|uniref:lipopolysaccharide biosynthesis protein n=1 Tax=Herbaspirillum sp. GW103 TaxID=1175306 RepID=UPI000555E57D|nr:lipopolysaccharide biosynthesis protein [Herbaspirillum sp. GW103]